MYVDDCLVSLLFITMIPIDCEIANFSLCMFVYFLCNNYNIGELTSITSKKEWLRVLFSRVPHPLIMKSSFASKLHICLCLPCYTALQTDNSMKSISSCHYGNTGNLLMTACSSTISESQWKGERVITLHFWCCLTFYWTKDSVINTSGIIAVIKFSMKQWSGKLSPTQ